MPSAMIVLPLPSAVVGGSLAFAPGPVLRGDHVHVALRSRSVAPTRTPARALRTAGFKFCAQMATMAERDELEDRTNAHGVGLLQNPFDEAGRCDAFPGLPGDLLKKPQYNVPVPDRTPLLDPWGEKGGLPAGCPDDPFVMVSEELAPFTDSIKEVVAAEHPILSEAAKYFFAKKQGKRFRPTIVMLMAKATAPTPAAHKEGDIYRKQAELG